MKTLTLYEIDQLKDKKLITQVLSSQDILSHYNTVDALKEADLVTVTDPSKDIEEAVCYDYSQDYFTINVSAAGDIKVVSASMDEDIDRIHDYMSYSKDGETWTTFSTLSPEKVEYEDGSCNKWYLYVYSISTSVGDKVLFKSNGFSEENIDTTMSQVVFIGNANVRYDVSGNILSLAYGDNFKNHNELPGTNPTIFAGLFTRRYIYNFDGSESLINYCITSAENLILPTTLADYCYYQMFEDCASLTSAPELPATTLASECYKNMFDGCNSLTAAPELPATTLAGYCYQGMFSDCTSLTSAPELPATTLTNSCYSSMFSGCTSLASVTCLATNISAQNSHKKWLENVSATGTFVKAASMSSWPTGDDGIPSGWTVEDES